MNRSATNASVTALSTGASCALGLLEFSLMGRIVQVDNERAMVYLHPRVRPRCVRARTVK